MIDQKLVHEVYGQIANHLENKNLKEALDQLGQFIKNTPEWNLHSEFEDIKTAYHYMLQYYRQNINDPQRTLLHNELIRKLHILNDKMLFSLNSTVSTQYYYHCFREQKRHSRTWAEYQLMLESFTEDSAVAQLLHTDTEQEKALQDLRTRHEQTITELFKKAWTSPVWDLETASSVRNILQSVLIQPNDLALLVSAVTLGALEVYDARKILFLMDAYEHAEVLVSQRALIGIVILGLHYSIDNQPSRLEQDTEIMARLSLLNDNPNFLRNITDVQIQLLRTRETEKADKKMREEIIPEVMKKTDMLRNAKLGLEELEEDLLSNDMNPEWEQFNESNLGNKLKEIGDMKLEGIDVYMSTFSQLKTYPFFREIGNWFYPFDPYHSMVAQCMSENERKNNLLIQSILNSSFFCNSDKYSFFFTLNQIPATQRETYMSHLNEQASEELQSSLAKQQPEILRRDVVSRQYIQDLYRFYKVFSYRHEFQDIFKESLNLYNCPLLKESISNQGQQKQIAEYLFQKNYYTEASHLYEELTVLNIVETETFQKLGFCYQKMKIYHKAIKAYRQADIQQPDNIWTNRHLAQCYRLSKEPDKAIAYYEKVEEVQPNDLTVLLRLGQCYAEQERYEEALARFFKVEYLDQQSIKAQRAIAWCSFITNKMEQAERYYNKLLRLPQPSKEDYLNAGHVAWCKRDVERAANLYIEGSLLEDNDHTFFTEQIVKDKHELLVHGVHEEEIPLMLDIIRYGITQ